MKLAENTELNDYNQDFIYELNQLVTSIKRNNSASQLKNVLESHILKMAELIKSEFFLKGAVPKPLLKCFDWGCYRAICAFSGPEQEDIDKQYKYVQMSIDYAFTVKSDYYIAEAFTNKLYLCLDRKDPWGLRNAVSALKEANAKLSPYDRQKFEEHIMKSIKDKLYAQEQEEASLMDGIECISFGGSQNKPRLTQFELERQRALERNLLAPKQEDSLEELLDLFERKCGLTNQP